jgi:hypothetical protein
VKAVTLQFKNGQFCSDFPFEKTHVQILGSKMFFVDVGNSGSSVVTVFLHGNPTPPISGGILLQPSSLEGDGALHLI